MPKLTIFRGEAWLAELVRALPSAASIPSQEYIGWYLCLLNCLLLLAAELLLVGDVLLTIENLIDQFRVIVK